MPDPARILPDAPSGADLPDAQVSASGIDAAANATDIDSADTVHIELDFNAFADHVPPDQHARRVAQSSDPSVQDFADQALELAALRAELKRLERDYSVLQHTLRMRDMRLHALQEELSAVRSRSRDGRPAPSARNDMPVAHELSSTLDLIVTEQTAAATIALDQPRPVEEASFPAASKRRLIPLDQSGEAISLSREIMTIGRTKDNDICIPSRAVSRDHARVVIGSRSVTVIDMQSANGCFVNDEPVKRHKLREGDVLRIGDRSFRFASDV
jgi:hypothetical protein